ncbi:MAG: OmpH family outer membrane protein [Bacteroidetes bacterium]|nr:OmpH family outer membrane protein [Bacteroidota bacterium]MCH8524165.1 OmpH family outer membrane protein [Balneolales bacterium]
MNKQTLIFSLVLVGMALSSHVALAQNQRIAFIDSEFILSRMPEYSGLEQRLRALTDGWREEIDEIQRDIDRLEREFTAREILYTDEVRQQRLNEIEARKRAKDQFINARFGPEGEYFRQQQQILEPLQRRIMEAVEAVADRDNLDFVFDRAGDFLFLYTRSQWNISEDVLLEMGIQINQ